MKYIGLICDYCGKVYDSYNKGKYHHYCCVECRLAGRKGITLNVSEEDRRKASERMRQFNLKNNTDPAFIEKHRAGLLARKANDPNRYKNRYIRARGGKPLHRVLMEKYLGRSLSDDEVVHHIDGNKHNNEISNLRVMTRRDHTFLHVAINKITKELNILCLPYSNIK